jgi:hypothetical protein
MSPKSNSSVHVTAVLGLLRFQTAASFSNPRTPVLR